MNHPKLILQKKKRLEKLLDLYLEDNLPKEEFLRNRKELDTDIADAEIKYNEVKSQLEIITLTPERIEEIHQFAQTVREGLAIIDKEPDFATKREIINLLDVRAKLAVENGDKVVYATCILKLNVPQKLSLDYENL